MNSKTRRVTSMGRLAAFALAAAAFAYVARPAGSEPAAAATAQDTFGLERRINSVEQRLFSIDSRLGRLEQLSALPARTQPDASRAGETELELLRTELELLRRRVAEDECGLLRLDERTLAQPAREARRRGAGGAEEPCRSNAGAPLRLSSRQ